MGKTDSKRKLETPGKKNLGLSFLVPIRRRKGA